MTQAFGIEQHRGERKKNNNRTVLAQVSSVVTRDQFGQAQKKTFVFSLFFPYFGALLLGQGMDVDVRIVRSFSVNYFNPNPISMQLAGYSEILAQLLNIVEMEMVGNLLAKR